MLLIYIHKLKLIITTVYFDNFKYQLHRFLLVASPLIKYTKKYEHEVKSIIRIVLSIYLQLCFMFVLFWYIPYYITGEASKTYVKLVGWIMFLVDTPSHTIMKNTM